MLLFESILVVMFGAVLLSAASRRAGLPYPVVLAVAGTALAFVPGAPSISLDPDLVLTLLVAPILLDSAFDTSPRDLRTHWLSLGSLVVIAVGVTTFAVAAVVRVLVPDLSWAAAIALGAIVAPPDAVAATAILRRVRPPHRLIVILEGESLLNDAMALLIYRLAVASAAAAGFSPLASLPTLALVVLGSLGLGVLLGWLVARLLRPFKDEASAIIMQFITTFGIWIAAERLQLSGVITIVVYAMVLSRITPEQQSARLRIPSYAVWQTTVFVLQALAFVLIGLQLRPILSNLTSDELSLYGGVAAAVLATVILVRLAWVASSRAAVSFLYFRQMGQSDPLGAGRRPTQSDGLIIGWCGMRGIVTLAAAYALPIDFPHRELVLISAFTVVVGTLVIQGLTLQLLLGLIKPTDDRPVERELRLGRTAALEAGITAIASQSSDAAEAVRREYGDMLDQASRMDVFDTAENQVRRQAIAAARATAINLRQRGAIGDDAFHRLEEELDWLEVGAASRDLG